MNKNSIVTLFFFSLSLTLHAQLRIPAPSPSSKTFQTIGVTDIEISYSRPGVKGRSIFGENGLIPFGKLWRTGANNATKITFGDDVTLGTHKVEKGAYAILTKPGDDFWEIYLYPYESSTWNRYIDATPAASITVYPKRLHGKRENLLMTFDNITNESALLILEWEYTQIAIPLKVPGREKILPAIEKALGGPSNFEYFLAASYLHDENIDLDKALAYIQKTTKNGDGRFFEYRREALILADLGRKEEAIEAAKKSSVLAKKAGLDNVVELNDQSIRTWSKDGD
ncbi:MAG: DUF2911 domain-containing protein [Flavobacteriaceae bacterium]